jgi:hypothetical protein
MSCLKARVGERTGIFKAVSGVLVVCLPIIMACAEDASSAGWYLTKNCDTDFYDASTDMKYWAKGSVDGEKGASSTELLADVDYFVNGAKRFTVSGAGYVFPGSSLTLGDEVSRATLYIRGKEQTYKNLIPNKGYVTHAIYRSNTQVINYYDNVGAQIIVR